MFFKLTFQKSSGKDFIHFWSDCYDFGKYSDDEYLKNLNKDGTLSPENVQFLFEWKNNKPLSKKKQKTVDQIIENIFELNKFRQLPVISKEEFRKFWIFISMIIKHGMIWRVFLLHITRPQDYPIFDQHVLRAWNYIKNDKIEELDKTLEFYNEYRIFFFDLASKFEPDHRKVDQALMAFGQFLKTQFSKKIGSQ